jgi:hypothetical protein
MFDGHERERGVADVLEVMEEVLARLEVEVTRLAGGVRHEASRAVVGVLAAVTAREGGPEVVEGVAMGAEAFTGVSRSLIAAILPSHRSTPMTKAPSSVSDRAVASPMPAAAPVTTITWSSSASCISLPSVVCRSFRDPRCASASDKSKAYTASVS